VNHALCLRCDWRGKRLGKTCPNCGAALFRPREAARSQADTVEDVAPGRRPGRPERSRATLGLVAALAVVAVVAFELWAAADTDSSGGLTGTNGSAARGKLVVAIGEDGNHRLWVLDLASGGSRRGPSVPSDVTELVDVSSAAFGAIGIERRLPDGRTGVSILRAIERGAASERLGSGDLVAWGPDGRSLVFATNRDGPGDCSRVRIRLVSVRTREVAWALDDPGFCGPLLSISRSAAATYFTAPSGDRLGVYLTGSVGVPHLMFDDVAMLSAYPPAAFLFGDGSREAGRRDRSRIASDETLLGWHGVGGPLVVGSGGDPLVVERVLAWSGDGSEVALVGSVGTTSGVFRLDAGSGTGVREPEFVFGSRDVLDATFAVDGSLYLTRRDEILVAPDGSVARLALPERAETVTGPILWIP
jgi:hypothetical protein